MSRSTLTLAASLLVNVLGGALLVYKLLRRRRGRLQGDVYSATRATLFAALATRRASIVLVGDSLTDSGEWGELLALPGETIANRGINGDRTDDVLARVEDIVALQPRVVALLIGVNDLLAGRGIEETAAGIARVADSLRARLPRATVLVQGLLPVEDGRAGTSNRAIAGVNELLSASQRERFIDPGAALRGAGMGLDPSLSDDGLHLLGEGYRRWGDALRPFIMAALASTPAG